jgi:Ca2+-binding RTX toxin-like protein
MAPKKLHVNKIQYTYTQDTEPLFLQQTDRQMGVETGLRELLDETVDVYVLDGTGISFSGRNVAEAFIGTSGSDAVNGGGGQDVILGNSGNDALSGGRGDDLIFGDSGNDELFGDQGNDILVGGLGANRIDGGKGVDTAAYVGTAFDYDIRYSGSGVSVATIGSGSVNDFLINVEFLQFGYDVYSVETLLSDNVHTGGSQGQPASAVDDFAEAPILTVPDGIVAQFGSETGSLLVPFNLYSDLVDKDGSESLTVKVSGLPAGASLNNGVKGSDGVWVLSQGDLQGLMIDLPPTITADFELSIVAEAQENYGGAIAISDGSVTVDVVAWMAEQASDEQAALTEPSFVDPDNIIIPGPFEGGNILWVGAGQQYTDLQAAVDASGQNDTIYLASGTYDFGQVMIDHDVNIIGVGEVTLTSADRVYKGALVTKSGVSLYVENLTFESIYSSDKNGAGIRHQGSDLIVVDSNFINNENGILATADGTGDVFISNSTFERNGKDGYAHNMYIKDVINLVVVDSSFLDTNGGHHVKSMAQLTIVKDSLLVETDGMTSYSIDVSDGGDLLVTGNTIIQHSDAVNPNIISYSVSRGGESGDVVITGNTVINDHSNATLLINKSNSIAQIVGNEFSVSNGAVLGVVNGLANQVNNMLNGVLQFDRSYDEGAIEGAAGNDTMLGTSGDDVLNGGAGDDYLWGGVSQGDEAKGSDLLIGGVGDDHLYGGDHNDTLLGGEGNDFLDGGKNNDIVAGEGGNDILIGGHGADTLIGGGGNDLIAAGGAADLINGGDGMDVAFFANNYADYQVSAQATRWFVKAPQGLDDWGLNKVADVEFFQFADGLFDASTGIFHKGVILGTYSAVISGNLQEVTLPGELADLKTFQSLGVIYSSVDTAQSSGSFEIEQYTLDNTSIPTLDVDLMASSFESKIDVIALDTMITSGDLDLV